jgi:hypothetical protein
VRLFSRGMVIRSDILGVGHLRADVACGRCFVPRRDALPKLSCSHDGTGTGSFGCWETTEMKRSTPELALSGTTQACLLLHGCECVKNRAGAEVTEVTQTGVVTECSDLCDKIRKGETAREVELPATSCTSRAVGLSGFS